MGYFDGISAGSFKLGADGRHIYFPFGVYGRGYVMDEERYNRVRRAIVSRIAAFLILCPLSVLYSVWGVWPLAGVFLIWDHFARKAAVKGCPVSEEKLSREEVLRNSSASYGRVWIWFMITGSSLFVLASLFLLFRTDKILSGLSGLVFFGFCLFSGIRLLRAKHGQRAES